MDIIVEIGNDQEKDQIKQELAVIEKAVNAFDPPLEIRQVIVPLNFDKKVNELQSTTTYISERGVIAQAKIVEFETDFSIVFSPRIYTGHYDFQVRMFIYMHEVFHIVNKRKFLNSIAYSGTKLRYFTNISRLFDEYMADRQSLEFTDDIFPSRSPNYQTFLNFAIEGFISLVKDDQNDNFFMDEIEKFRLHGNVEIFLKNTTDKMSEIALSIAHLFSLIDYGSEFKEKETELTESKFLNDKTFTLIDFFRAQYKELKPNLERGLPLIIDFMTNFGVRFEDTDYGEYCHVLDY